MPNRFDSLSRYWLVAISLLYVCAADTEVMAGQPGEVVMQNQTGQAVKIRARISNQINDSWDLGVGKQGYLTTNGQRILAESFFFTIETAAGSIDLQGGTYDPGSNALVVTIGPQHLPRQGDRSKTFAPRENVRVKVFKEPAAPVRSGVPQIVARNNTTQTMIFTVETYVDSTGKLRRGGEYRVNPGQIGRIGIRAKSANCKFTTATGQTYRVKPTIEGSYAIYSASSRAHNSPVTRSYGSYGKNRTTNGPPQKSAESSYGVKKKLRGLLGGLVRNPELVKKGIDQGKRFLKAAGEPGVQEGIARQKEIRGYETVTCSRCEGSGQYLYAFNKYTKDCGKCGGHGQHYRNGQKIK